MSAVLRAVPVRRSLRILLVEDEPLIAMSLAEIVHELGHEAIESFDPTHALALVERGEAVDVLITDINMPGMDGRDLARRVRRTRPGLPIVFATGYSAQKVPDLRDDPLARFIRKPFGSDEVARILDSFDPIALDATFAR